ncbi:DNA-directed RNA polymerase subunit delta [Dendrosporobacter sp. 1207_IL3150]|uniref:DNA-directed RNA polymerase subunit delta n=1 Tax=Dendrosporobacter sp. 1207_IL3150 TaxID=3084054 RepID=UPI002FDB4DFD
MLDMKQAIEVDIAYQILRQSGQPMYFRDLINKVIDIKAKPVASLSHAISEIHTQINMDSRFAHLGKGMWGLNEWTPQNTRRSSSDDSSSSSAPTTKRRERLLEEIQQDYVAATTEPGEAE